MPSIFSTALRDTMTSLLRDEWNSALGSAANIHFFDGTAPATCEDADAGTELAALPMSSTPFDAPSANIFIANAITNQGVAANGTCQYFRMKDSGGTVVCQGNCDTSPGASIVFDTVSWTTSMVVSVTNFDVTVLLFAVDI